MIGGKDLFGQNKDPVSATAHHFATVCCLGATWSLTKVTGLLLSHAYLVRASVIPYVAALLQLGFAADNALAKASREHVMAAVLKNGQLVELARQRPKAQTKRPRA